MDNNALTPGEIIAIIKHRKWSLLVPALAVFAIAAGVALFLPPTYKSTATILVKEQEIPSEYVTTSMTSFAFQRIQSINQRVMTSQRLLELINRFDLYKKMKKRKTTDDIIARMREDIILEPINVDVSDRKTGRARIATIAFTIAYEGGEPGKVQKVLNTITSLFLKEDLQVREKQAGDTLSFLDVEKNRVKEKLARHEAELASFKEKNIHSLPDVFQVNVQALNYIQNNRDRETQRLNNFREREQYLETQLASIHSELDLEEEKHLETIELELANLMAMFSDRYPDVIKLKKEITRIKEVIAQKKENKGRIPDNPVYITLSSQLAGIRSDMASSRDQIRSLDRQADEYKQKIAATPRVEETYNAYITDRNNLRAKFNELQQKAMEARVAMGLQTEQKGERFTLAEPARLPEKPVKPNRHAILIIGLVLGLGIGIAVVAIKEFMDSSFKNPEQLERMTGLPVLVEIPPIITTRDRIIKALRQALFFLANAGAMAGILYVVDTYVMDLTVLASLVIRRFSL